MLYYLLQEHFNVIQYISFRAAGAAITALFICFLIGPKIIRTLIVYHFGETIRHNGPESHHKKEGTPTMGGIIILMAIILPTFLWAKLTNPFIQIILISVLWMGIIGFIDDYLKIKKKYSKGLIARYKIAGQLILGLFISYMIFNYSSNNNMIVYSIINADGIKEIISQGSTSIPFLANGYIDLNYFYIPFIIIVVMATSNAINLTDGLDGLSTGLTAIACLVFAIIAYASSRLDFSDYLNIIFIPYSGELFIFCLAVIGSCIGFLWYNANPAKIFMGDTGSLSLGAALGTLAILLKKEILLIIVGGVFVIESLSVIIQIMYFKYTKIKYGEGKRLFKMAPLHHHFELSGWNENHVVVRFWIIGILLALLSLTTFKLQ
ncbi:MAG: phospho-N-acetylmuramoyl-pentapeptide-transferase [Candidatus Marinimicrobia bacterium]|nr:phospho-N-acetylmuramoyl-pentapeptide-transferase [Candidatus Neomarinimicrobiota bacterium]|tara:strand:- start:20580 stop:21713 length:1134 start_codon:yes stop_codon:yes gene_type:complete